MKVYVVMEESDWYYDYEDHGSFTNLEGAFLSKAKAEQCVRDAVKTKIVENPYVKLVDDELVQFKRLEDGGYWGGIESDKSCYCFYTKEKEVIE